MHSLSHSLKDTQVTHFQEAGFLVLPDFVSEQVCAQLKAQSLQLVSEFQMPDISKELAEQGDSFSWESYYYKRNVKECYFFEKKAMLPDGSLDRDKESAIQKISYALHLRDPIFNAFSYSCEIGNLATALGLQKPVILQSMYLFKQPRIGSPVHWHQDSSYMYSEPDTLLGLWLAIDDATVENGCLWAIPGGHKEPLKFRSLIDKNGKQDYLILDESPWRTESMVPLEVKRGSLVVLHGRTPHMSKANLSEKSRHAYAMHLMCANSHYPTDNWLQPKPQRVPFTI
jgi:phytanoyl-CoA hydroxylase